MTTLTNDVLTDRSAALQRSGFGQRFKLFQPHNLAFWVYLVLVAMGVVVMVQQAQPALAAYEGSLVLTLIWFVLYTVPFWLFFRHIDRFDSVPERLAVAAFVYGAFAATGTIAINANQAMLPLWAKLNGQEFAAAWAPALTAPFTEELAKGSGLILLLVLAPKLIRTAFDGLIVGAFLGLGFQVVEDVLYGINSGAENFASDPIGGSTTTNVMRAVVGITSHWVYSAIFCAGLIYLIGRPDEPRRIGRGLFLVVAAMACHGAWDAIGGLAAISGVFIPVIYTVVPIVLIALFVWIYKSSVVTERRWMRELMEPEVALGVVTQDEVDAMAGSRKERKAFVRAHKGHKSHVHAKHVLHAAGDLASEIAKEGGTDTERVAFARSEVVRVRSA